MKLLDRLMEWFRGKEKQPAGGGDPQAGASASPDPEAAENRYDVEYENLAVPEVHTGKAAEAGEPEQPGGDAAREFQAIPEYSTAERRGND